MTAEIAGLGSAPVEPVLKAVPLADGGTDLYIDPKAFPAVFAGGVPVEEARVYALSQRPVTAAAVNEPTSGPQAWHTIPSYDLISGADKVIAPAAQQFMAKRANAQVEVVEGASHMGVFAVHPDAAAAIIERAARETA
jgi:pimeloyl-ACP methyl ester carboxylesterase